MEDGVLSVARGLLESKVLVQRPPSGLRDKRTLAHHYQRELSSTTRGKSDQLQLLNRPSSASREKTARRVQSAKTRTNDGTQGYGSADKSRRIKSAQPRISGDGKKAPHSNLKHKDLLSLEHFELSYEPQRVGDKRGDRPGSAKSSCSETTSSCLKPSVYGFEKNRRVYGSESDLTDCQDSPSHPFKLSDPVSKTEAWQAKKKQQMACESSLIHQYNGLPIPKSLLPLTPWLQTSAPSDVIGIDPSKCLVFLPCLTMGGMEDLPTVPSTQHVDDELPYHEVVYKPLLPWKPKKYKHPSWKNTYEEFKHSKRRHSEIFSEDGRLLHVPQRNMRTADVIKREIDILENLIKGVGTYEGTCAMAHFQADITNLQTMAGETLAMVDERPETPEPADLTGLRAFYQQHDEVIMKIKLEHQLCMEELAKLEETGDTFISYSDKIPE